jgi:hypothetical protein
VPEEDRNSTDAVELTTSLPCATCCFVVVFMDEQLERVKGIEPSYSAWKSPNLPKVFKAHSDKSRPSGQLRSLQNFLPSEWLAPRRFRSRLRKSRTVGRNFASGSYTYDQPIYHPPIKGRPLRRRGNARDGPRPFQHHSRQ